MIEFDRVAKEYDGRRVVDAVSLTVERGEFCVVLGTSGSGKSTLLKMVNRLVAPTQGAIRIDGEDVARVPLEPLRRRIGYAIQSVGLFPHWTIAENVAAVPRLLKWPRERIRQRVDELLDLLQLDPAMYRDRYPRHLSGGQQQRVGVARSLAADPDLLLMDEPFGALDPLTREALQIALADIHKSTGKTIVFVTHDIEEALRLADRIAILDGGRLIQQATPVELLKRPANDFIRDFVGRSDIGLKLLSLRTVGDRVVAPASDSDPAEAPIDAGTSLRDALAQMIVRRTDRLRVHARDGRILGTIRLADIVGPDARP